MPLQSLQNKIMASLTDGAVGPGGPTFINPPQDEDDGSWFAAAYENYDKRPLYRDEWMPGGYSAVDLNVYIYPPEETQISQPIKFGSLSLLTVSSHRDKFPVSALSRVGSKAFTSGHRTIAGTLAFNTFQRDAFDWSNMNGQSMSWRGRGKWRFHLSPDELPPFDIQVVTINDFGDAAVKMIKGVTLLDSGCTYSLDNIILTESYSYMALDQTPLKPISEREPRRNPAVDYTRPFVADLTQESTGLGFFRDEDYSA